MIFASAYKQLSHAERSFVDQAVMGIEIAAHRAGEKISYALNRPVPDDVVNRAPEGYLTRPLVTAAITERIVQIASERELTGERVIKELMSISFANIGNYIRYENDAPYFDLTDCTPEQLAAVKSIKIKSTGDGMTLSGKTEIEVQFHEKIPAIKLLGEYLGLFTGDNLHLKTERAAAQAMVDANAPVERIADIYATQIG